MALQCIQHLPGKIMHNYFDAATLGADRETLHHYGTEAPSWARVFPPIRDFTLQDDKGHT